MLSWDGCEVLYLSGSAVDTDEEGSEVGESWHQGEGLVAYGISAEETSKMG